MHMLRLSNRLPLLVRAAALIACVSAFGGGTAMAQTGDNVLIVANESSERSLKIADYYAKKRSVPPDQIVRVHLRTDDEIDRVTYLREIEGPVAQWILRHSAEDRILYLVLTK